MEQRCRRAGKETPLAELEGEIAVVNCPIQVHAKPYRGTNQKRINEFHQEVEAAKQIRDHIDLEMENRESHVFTYAQIAVDTGLSRDIVCRLLLPIDGGQTGITVVNPRLRKES